MQKNYNLILTKLLLKIVFNTVRDNYENKNFANKNKK